MKIVTSDQMREIERACEGIGIPMSELMENAGLAVAREVDRYLRGTSSHSIMVLVGPGNNGGDGLVAARHLRDWGARVSLFLCGGRREDDLNYRLTKERGIDITEVTSDDSLTQLDRLLSSNEVVIDAIFGTGKTRPIEGIFKEVLERVRKAREMHPELLIIALDLPSGLGADGGEPDPSCLSADVTITLGYPKLGLFTFPGGERVGRLITADIGIPDNLAQDVTTELMTPDWARSSLPQRPIAAHKGSFGRVLVCAGSINYIGAAYLACSGAVRVGAGLVTLATARSLQPILASKLTEVTYAPLPESEMGIIASEASGVIHDWLPGYEVLLMGCGLGQSPSAVDFISECLLALPEGLSPAIVLDADALNTLARTPLWWQRFGEEAVLTPHPGEMARLTGASIEEVERDRLGAAKRAASEWGKVVVLKGAYTLVASPEGIIRISPFANPGLASAGTGDVLAGAIAGLLAQGLPLFDAASLGVYLHGRAGDIVKSELGEAGMVASDLLPALPRVIKGLKEEQDAPGH